MKLRQCYISDAMAIYREKRDGFITWDMLVQQISGGVAWVFGDAKPLAIGGVYPFGSHGEAWFRPAHEAKAHMLPLLVAVRKALRAESCKFPDGLVCGVKKGHLPGERIAWFLGFKPTYESDALGGRVWRMSMGDTISGLFGGETSAQKKQKALLDEQQRKQDAVEQGQIAARNAGRGLLSFVDNTGGAGSGGPAGLPRTLGGVA